jgi:enediyne biosynthesis protein E4
MLMKRPLPTRKIRAEQAPERVRRGRLYSDAALRWARCVLGMVLLVVGVRVFTFANTTRQATDPTSKPARSSIPPAAQAEIPQAAFTDITNAAGIDFRHQNGARGEKLLPETMGGGCAFFDYDSDGDQDLLFVNSESWFADEQATSKAPATMALYRNDGSGNFEDVTRGSGLDIALYGMGVAVGDYDNDGRIDVFLSAVGANQLFRNRGGGKFEEVTVAAGVGGDSNEWSSGCGWFDFDNDGDLDLFVCNYVKWTRERDLAQHFRLPDGQPAYGRPQNFAGAFPYLYRNDGQGTFTDVSRQAGIQIRDPVTGAAVSKSLGVTFNDFDGDGWLDVAVANDTVQNQLFRNCGNGTFEEVGALAGIAFDEGGSVRGAMGIDAARFRNDGALGIAIGNFSNEMMALYVANSADMQFTDEATAVGLGPSTQLELTFGTCFVDYDLDGALDLFATNGHLEPKISEVQPSQQYAQPPQLFWNGGTLRGGKLLPVPSLKIGSDFARPIVGRGASFADIDGDGDLDLLITSNGGAPRLLRNDQNLGHHWLRLKLVGSNCNRDAIGAEVEVQLPDRTLRRRVMPTRSYLSQVELPLTFGLGMEDRVQSVTIHWPDGSRQIVPAPQVDRAYEIEQGGKPVASLARLSEERRAPIAASVAEGSRRVGRPTLLADVPTSCGDYLQMGGHAASRKHRSPDRPRTCHGPTCSKAPLDHRAPPTAPSRSQQDQQDALSGTHHLPALAYLCGLVPADSDALLHFATDRIFRPPRCC